jgi:hypothetical protein
MHMASSTIFLHTVIFAGVDARGQAVLANPVFASLASKVAGVRANILDTGVAVVTAAGHAVAVNTIVRAAGNAACASTAAADVPAAGLEDLGFALLPGECAAVTAAVCRSNGSAAGVAQW